MIYDFRFISSGYRILQSSFPISNAPLNKLLADIAAFVIAHGRSIQEAGKEKKTEDEEEDE